VRFEAVKRRMMMFCWVLGPTSLNGAKTEKNIIITVLNLNLGVNILYYHFQGKGN
jgi:hypothetical protein